MAPRQSMLDPPKRPEQRPHLSPDLAHRSTAANTAGLQRSSMISATVTDSHPSVHGAPYHFWEPARFSLAHGGKDRHPYPVPIKIYDQTIRVMKSAVLNAVPDAHGTHSAYDDRTVDAIPVPDHVARSLFPAGECFGDLTRNPFGRSEPDATLQLAPQDNQLKSKHRVISFKP